MTVEQTPHNRSQNPDRDRSPSENPKIITLLGSAGLTAVDFQLFDRLYQQDFSIFVHGSIIEDRIKPTSDVDFTVIGNIDAMPADLHDTLMPGLAAAQGLQKIDYVSTSLRSQQGRKISLHVSEPDFRDAQPQTGTPFATEYRPGVHAKSGPRNYFLSGADRDGNVRLVNFLSTSRSAGSDGSTVTDIPQTGKLTLKGNAILVDGKEKTDVIAQDVIRVRPDGSFDETHPLDSSEELMMLGLEFDKMASDTPMYHDPSAEQRFVKDPAIKSMEALGEYTKTDPSVITNRMFGELAKHWPKVKPHKAR